MHAHRQLIDRLNPRTCFLGEVHTIHSQARRRWPLRRPQIQSRVRSLTLSRHLRFFAYNLEAKDRDLRRSHKNGLQDRYTRLQARGVFGRIA